jgi:hypothetical protein
MAKTVTTLTEVRIKSGSSARGPWTMSIFKAADGREYTTFKGDLASKANALLNQTVELEFSESQNGQYTNYDLEDVAATAGPTVADAVRVQAPPVVNGSAKNDQYRTKEQIMRTDALNAALTLFGIIGLDPLSSADEFEGWFESLYTLIEQGVFETPGVSVEA